MARRRRRSRRRSIALNVSKEVSREIGAVAYLALAVLTVLSIQGGVGIVGEIWMGFLQPILGWGVYAIPVLFTGISLTMFFVKKFEFGIERIIGVILMMISVLSIFHLSVPSEDLFDIAQKGGFGGYTGFVTNFVLRDLLVIGNVGAGVIFVTLLLISVLLTFHISLKDLWTLVVPEIKFDFKANEKNERKAERTSKKSIEDLIEDMDEGQMEQGIRILNSQIRSDENEESIDLHLDGDEDEEEEDEETEEEEEQEEVVSKKKKEEDYYWEFPDMELLELPIKNALIDEKTLRTNADTIRKKLDQFGIDVSMKEVHVGPTVIQYTFKPAEHVKLSKITALKNDLALALAARAVRIEAPIPGKSLVGVELPNENRSLVYLKEILESTEYKAMSGGSPLALPLGRDVSGRAVVGDLETMPHLLVAGATGSGKSVGMNTFLLAMIYQNSPKDLKFIMIDPKRVELKPYNGIPHLLAPVITDPEKAAISLRWLVAEMMRRYQLLSDASVRNIKEYNAQEGLDEKMPRIVVVIDELADLMMAAGKEVEASICRIAQMARAVGMHLIIATQRPSVDVITGLIKANVPARIAFAVSSSIDSRVILDGTGAEDLLGRGDMLYLPGGMSKPMRVQGIYVDTKEVERVTNFAKLHSSEPEYNDDVTSIRTASSSLNGIPASAMKAKHDDEVGDALYADAVAVVREHRKASASLLQRRLKVGYARAARIVDLLEEKGVVGPANGAKPREIYMD